MNYSQSGGQLREYELDTNGLSDVNFGKDIAREFGLRSDIIFLNHGSYGTVPRRVLDLQHRYNQEREDDPEMWYRVNAMHYVTKARQEIASRIHSKLDNVAIVDNATSALNCSLRAFPFKAGDALLDTVHNYDAIQNLCEDFTSRMRPDVERIHMNLELPIESEDSVIKAHEEILRKHPNIKCAIVDHITMPSSILMPLARLCQLFHSYGVAVIVDGAHTFGHVPLDMAAIGADVYTSNIHKWAFSPRGAALIWFSDKAASWVRPPNTSRKLGKSLDMQFFDQGTRDHVPSICARHGIQFIDAIGGMEKVMDYNTNLATQGKQLLEEIGLEPLAVPLSMEAPNLKLFKMPPMSKYPYSTENALIIHQDIFQGSNIFGNILPFEGYFWLRISAQVYNDLDDMRALTELIRAFLRKNKD